MTGVEGYVESAASGFLAGVELARRLEGRAPVDFPQETAVGALGLYVSNTGVVDFQPMNVNFGIIPPLGYRVKGKRNKNAELSARSLRIIDALRALFAFDFIAPAENDRSVIRFCTSWATPKENVDCLLFAIKRQMGR